MREAAAILVVLLSIPASATFTVAIDPGHGGAREGAYGPKGVKEKDVSLAVATALKELLSQDPGTSVIFTREGDADVALHERMNVANRSKADIFVSIHCNSMPTKRSRKEAFGVETYFLSADATDKDSSDTAARENADIGHLEQVAAADDPISMILTDLTRTQAHGDAKALAERVHKSLFTNLKTKNRGVRQAPFLVLMGAQMPAVLAEIGFISHPWEGKLLTTPEHQLKVAQALAAAITDFRIAVYEKRSEPAPAPEVAPPVVAPSPTPPPAPSPAP